MIQSPVVNGAAQYSQYMKMAKIAVHMQRTGWRIDKEKVTEHERNASARAKDLKLQLIELTGLDPEPSGLGPQWAEYFFDTLELPPVSFDKHTRKPQLNAAALLTYANENDDETIRLKAKTLYLYRKNTKLLNAFLHPLLENSADRIHPSFNITGTKGARWSASGPNIQQVSKDVTEGNKVLIPSFKDVFIADPGCVIIKADFNALENRLQGYVGRIQQILDWMAEGKDAHIEVALYLFGLKRLESDDEMKKAYKPFRNAAKTINYGLPYNITDNVEQIWKQLKQNPQLKNLTIPQTQKLRKRYFQIMRETLAWQLRTQQQINDHGWIEAPLMHRRLYLQRNTRGYNQALNFQMQTTGGDLINRAIIGLYQDLDWDSGEQIRAQVHDELVCQAPEAKALEIADLVEHHMGAPVKIGDTMAQFPAEAAIGYDWKNTVSKAQWKKQIDNAAHPMLDAT